MLKKKRLNLGCGRRTHSEWINVDLYAANSAVIQHDLRKPLPFDSASIDVAYHSHVLEHFARSEALAFIRECIRVLKPGGVLRVAVPDLESICSEYLRQIALWRSGHGDAADLEWMRIELLDQLVRQSPGGEMLRYLRDETIPNAPFVISRLGDEAKSQIGKRSFLGQGPKRKFIPRVRHWFRLVAASLMQPQDFVTKVLLSKANQELLRIGHFRMAGEVHKWMYDEASITSMLTSLGLVNVARCLATESRVDDWPSIGLDVNDSNLPRKPDSIYMEASKPQTAVE